MGLYEDVQLDARLATHPQRTRRPETRLSAPPRERAASCGDRGGRGDPASREVTGRGRAGAGASAARAGSADQPVCSRCLGGVEGRATRTRQGAPALTGGRRERDETALPAPLPRPGPAAGRTAFPAGRPGASLSRRARGGAATRPQSPAPGGFSRPPRPSS